MKASETRINDFLASNKTQFVIPVYQRNYDWSKIQCNQLLNDIFEVGNNKKMSAHFIGSIVYIYDDNFTVSRLKELTIIDGQQRLTTLTLIYVVLFKLAKEINDEVLVSEINETYLINKFAQDDEKLKLRPTENNDKALKHLINENKNIEYQGFSKIIENFNFLKSRIKEENYTYLMDGLDKLMFVEISLDREKDNPQRIFESLNSTGLDLSQADLIRNYILMGLKRKEQIRIYNHYWEKIERLTKDEYHNNSKLSDFIRDYLTYENKKIPNKGKVYSEFKDRYPKTTFEDLEQNVTSIKSFAQHYNKLINPKNEMDREVRNQLEYINRLEINVAYPFLMKVYDDYSKAIIDKQVFLDILDLVQSFTFRRFILALPTNALNKIFMNLSDKIDKNNYLYSIQKSLLQRSGVQRFPKNNEVIEALKVKDVYNIKAKNRIYLLERLENFKNKETVLIDGNPNITIEHIFPKNPDPKWKIELGNEEYTDIKDNFLNTISNLTLSGNNGKLANKTFINKRDLKDYGYKDSRLWLNKYLAGIDRWGKLQLEERFKIISERFLNIWKYPNIAIEDLSDGDEINIFDAEDPKHKKLEYAIFLDQKIDVNQVAKLYVEVLKQLFDLQPETFFTTDLAPRIVLTKNPDELRQSAPINDTYFIETNIDNMGKFERLKKALTIFDLEDELSIKYSEEA